MADAFDALVTSQPKFCEGIRRIMADLATKLDAVAPGWPGNLEFGDVIGQEGLAFIINMEIGDEGDEVVELCHEAFFALWEREVQKRQAGNRKRRRLPR